MNGETRATADLDRVIHEPGRMMIVALLAAVEKCDFLFLLRETGQDESNLSIHLAKLEQAGYVEIDKRHRAKTPRRLLQLTGSGRAAFEAYRKKLNVALAEQLKLASDASKRTNRTT
jgi:DNA-binding MarR family transcriptional regulator